MEEVNISLERVNLNMEEVNSEQTELKTEFLRCREYAELIPWNEERKTEGRWTLSGVDQPRRTEKLNMMN